MHFRVRHTTRYPLQQACFPGAPYGPFAPPAATARNGFIRFQLRIEPEPAIFSEVLDSEGNDVAYTWFEGSAETLLVRSEFDVETLRENPFDYIMLDDKANRLPLSYPAAWRDQLAPYLASSHRGDGPVGRFARSIAGWAGHETLPFLAVLNGRISQRLPSYGT